MFVIIFVHLVFVVVNAALRLTFLFIQALWLRHALQIVSARHGHQPVILLGHSMGGLVASVVAQLTSAPLSTQPAAATHPSPVAVAAVVTVNSPLWSLPGDVAREIQSFHFHNVFQEHSTPLPPTCCRYTPQPSNPTRTDILQQRAVCFLFTLMSRCS